MFGEHGGYTREDDREVFEEVFAKVLGDMIGDVIGEVIARWSKGHPEVFRTPSRRWPVSNC
jgi:hypothetical protein